eukprot:jgi/Mesen1/10544/ME000083S10046
MPIGTQRRPALLLLDRSFLPLLFPTALRSSLDSLELRSRTPGQRFVKMAFCWLLGVVFLLSSTDAEASWAFAPVMTIASTHAINFNQSPPNMTEQQFLDCEGIGPCAGGWIGNAYEYAARRTRSNTKFNSLVQYPYFANAGHTRKCKLNGVYDVRVTMYEQTNFYGVMGMLLALQKQPITVTVAADSKAFQSYRGKGIFQDPSCFASGFVNHAVTLMGYNFKAKQPYWIIRNSWGPEWGDKGDAYILMAGGDGICGINSALAIYPIVKGASPCNPNPCGTGSCRVKKGNAVCSCPNSFVAVQSRDTSQTCAPADPCSFYGSNPCAVGVCVNNGGNSGNYHCVCPPGWNVTQNSIDSTETCYSPSGPLIDTLPVETTGIKYVVQPGDSCYLLAIAFALDVQTLRNSNPQLNCNNIAASIGLVLHIFNSGYEGCQAFYPVAQGDTCQAIASLFGITQANMKDLNPALDCNKLFPGLQLCMKQPTSWASFAICDLEFPIRDNDNCPSLFKAAKISPARFYSLNPGFYCGHVLGRTLLAQTICVRGANPYPDVPLPPPGPSHPSPPPPAGPLGPPPRRGCPRNSKKYFVKRGDSCIGLIFHLFRRNRALFRMLNQNARCQAGSLFVRQRLCIP